MKKVLYVGMDVHKESISMRLGLGRGLDPSRSFPPRKDTPPFRAGPLRIRPIRRGLKP